jgi:aspartyl-tRNA synthetase
VRHEIDEGIRKWQNARAGTQVHTTMVRPWADCRHRSYFIGRDQDGKVGEILCTPAAYISCS